MLHCGESDNRAGHKSLSGSGTVPSASARRSADFRNEVKRGRVESRRLLLLPVLSRSASPRSRGAERPLSRGDGRDQTIATPRIRAPARPATDFSLRPERAVGSARTPWLLLPRSSSYALTTAIGVTRSPGGPSSWLFLPQPSDALDTTRLLAQRADRRSASKHADYRSRARAGVHLEAGNAVECGDLHYAGGAFARVLLSRRASVLRSPRLRVARGRRYWGRASARLRATSANTHSASRRPVRAKSLPPDEGRFPRARPRPASRR